MQPVEGYLTADGTFYPKGEDARLHEAIQAIKGLCESHKPKSIAADKFLAILSDWSPVIREFIDADDQVKAARVSAHQEDTRTARGDTTDDSNGDALDAAVEQLKASGSEYMPEMGGGPSSKGVQQRSKKHGA